ARRVGIIPGIVPRPPKGVVKPNPKTETRAKITAAKTAKCPASETAAKFPAAKSTAAPEPASAAAECATAAAESSTARSSIGRGGQGQEQSKRGYTACKNLPHQFPTVC